jgi:SAM-dependent methyltransferase
MNAPEHLNPTPLATSSARHTTPAPRDPQTNAAWAALHQAATAPYRQHGRFAWHFARGKLGRDPVFRGLLERGELGPAAPQGAVHQLRVVDIGCGQGLMASLLQSCSDLAENRIAGRWPAAWPAAPRATAYTGIELMPRDVERGRASVGGLALKPQFINGDMCSTALPACELVVILDVLHYVDHAAQAALLKRVRDALAAQHGRLLLRVGDMAQQRGFAVSQWVDRIVTMVRGHRVPPTWGRSVPAWVQLLQGLGFSVQTVPMSEGTPFANVLLVADLLPAGGGRA